MNASTAALPVVVIGAGPIGLAAAAHLVERGIDPLVLEAGPAAGTAVREWSHVRLFSTWAEVVDPAAEKLLAPTGWVAPDAATYPTGGDWAERYLQPLADVLGDQVRYGATRHRRLPRRPRPRRRRRPRRAALHRAPPARRRHRGADHRPRRHRRLRHLVHPEPGRRRRPARPRRARRRRPHLLPRPRPERPGRTRPLRGQAHRRRSAPAPPPSPPSPTSPTSRRRTPGTHAVWILRRGIGGTTFGGGEADQLPARGALGLRAKAAVEDGHADAVTGFRTAGRRAGRRRPPGPRRPRTAAASTRSTRSSS